MNKIKIPDFLAAMNGVFKNAGFQAYLVGGAVRDMLMKKTPSDFDLATNAKPEDVMRLFRRVIPTGIAHGTVTVHWQKREIEVTTFRAESEYSDGRHPDEVRFAEKIEEDLSRRDFTMNAIAASLDGGVVIDPFCGRDDIKARLIRTVGRAQERFSEDGLRPVRAIRFASQLDFTIEEGTFAALSKPEIHAVTQKISVERFRDEFVKMLRPEKPSSALNLLEESGILSLFIPEFSDCRGCIQKDMRGCHDFDVLDHLFYAADGAPKDKLNVRLAALFHDIGKPAAKTVEECGVGTVIHFYNHEKYSEEIARKVLVRLKFPNALVDSVCHLVLNHMFHYESDWKDAAVRRFLVRVKPENVDDLFDLRLADMYGMHNAPVRLHDSPAAALLLEFKERLSQAEREKSALSLRELAVNGSDLMALGVPRGKDIGRLLGELFNTVLDDPEQNTRERLLPIAQNLWNKMNAGQ
ncbi:MAG: CCA tRNA nucleotidyltransferase [Treponema sp.]